MADSSEVRPALPEGTERCPECGWFQDVGTICVRCTALGPPMAAEYGAAGVSRCKACGWYRRLGDECHRCRRLGPPAGGPSLETPSASPPAVTVLPAGETTVETTASPSMSANLAQDKPV